MLAFGRCPDAALKAVQRVVDERGIEECGQGCGTADVVGVVVGENNCHDFVIRRDVLCNGTGISLGVNNDNLSLRRQQVDVGGERTGDKYQVRERRDGLGLLA